MQIMINDVFSLGFVMCNTGNGEKLRYNSAREIWEGARVVEWDSLENCCGLRSTEGSNPSLPAEEHVGRRVLIFWEILTAKPAKKMHTNFASFWCLAVHPF